MILFLEPNVLLMCGICARVFWRVFVRVLEYVCVLWCMCACSGCFAARRPQRLLDLTASLALPDNWSRTAAQRSGFDKHHGLQSLGGTRVRCQQSRR